MSFFQFQNILDYLIKQKQKKQKHKKQKLVIIYKFLLLKMLSERNSKHSPTKQNISPQRHSLSPNKNLNIIQHLLNLLKRHNITIPSQFQEYKNKKLSGQFILKQANNDQNTQNKKMKVILSDYQFQLKKIEEDFAGYKVNVKIDKDKLINKFHTQVSALKKKIQQDNSHWHNKFIETEDRYKSQKQAFQRQINNAAQQKMHKHKQSLKHQYETKLHLLEQKVKSLKHKLQQKQKKMIEQQFFSMKQFNSQKQIQLKELCIKNEQKQSELLQQMNNKIQSIKFQKSIQEKKYSQTSSKHKQQIQKYKTQINNLIRQKDNLKADIKHKETHIIHLQLTIKGKDHRLLQIKKEMDHQTQRLTKQYQHEIESLSKSHEKQIQSIKSGHLNQLDKYYQRVNKLQNQKRVIQQHFRDQFLFLQKKFNQRISKAQDTEQIRNLRSQIISKNRQISRYQQDLRKSELQRQNNEKNYSRIFSSHSSRRKSANNTPRDKDAFFKQTNATDLKMFLKICNKDF